MFYEGDLHGTLDNLNQKISEKVNAISKDQFLSTPEQDLVEHVYAEMRIEPLTLYEDSMEMEQHETKIDVSGYRDRNPFGDRGPIYVQGIRVAVSVPFTGDAGPSVKPIQIPRYWSGEELSPQLGGALFEIACWDSSATILVGLPDEAEASFVRVYSDTRPLVSRPG